MGGCGVGGGACVAIGSVASVAAAGIACCWVGVVVDITTSDPYDALSGGISVSSRTSITALR